MHISGSNHINLLTTQKHYICWKLYSKFLEYYCSNFPVVKIFSLTDESRYLISRARPGEGGEGKSEEDLNLQWYLELRNLHFTEVRLTTLTNFYTSVHFGLGAPVTSLVLVVPYKCVTKLKLSVFPTQILSFLCRLSTGELHQEEIYFFFSCVLFYVKVQDFPL